ncbi:MAG: 30S ribosomal protein S1 [Helicobacter sp.]|nr:30S ribosomal protein S1 [Helicobacter sp.]MBD5167912.1 30S ribosomal protein S1 [Helicobacter sp.]MDE5816658.1 30S ribosomal protein S1 [Helicobacter sp.]MDE6044430.1 30S ribosomal protein S1 [Helicobacter sp.]MDE7195390.1 30S ribosomal protein S1 [Helicobacter sp.]
MVIESGQNNSHTEEDNEFVSWFEGDAKQSEGGRLTKGKIISINESEGFVFVDVNEKNEGRIRIEEITDAEGKLLFKKGDELDVVVINENGERPIVSHKKALKRQKIQKKIEELGSDYKDVVIEAKIAHGNKGGYTLEDADGVEYFMPRKVAALKEGSSHTNKRIKVCIINIKPEEHTIIVSRKRFFDIDTKNKQEKAQRLLDATEPLRGIIKNVTAFGMFVDVDGIEGLIHYTEISYKGHINPAKNFKEGQEVFVKAIGYDKDKKRISFSIKATTEDPWVEIENELEVGDAISVVVSNVESYGAFVDLGNDIEGFLHVSEISWDKNIKHPNQYLKTGQEIVVEVIEIDTKGRKLRVSQKNLIEKPFVRFCKTHKEGDVLKGKVATLTDFGAFVKLGEIDGLLHNEDAFWDKNLTCKNSFKEGEEIEVKIIRIDHQKERISLSRKSLTNSPVGDFSKTHGIDDIITGTIRDIKDFGVFINIQEGIDALIRTADLAPLNKDELQIGDTIEGAISMIDKANNKIRVSVRRLEKIKERESLKEFGSNEKITLGDVIRDKT